MVRTQIQLKEEQYRFLKRLAKEEDISMAELIRRAIDYFENRRSSATESEIRERAKNAAGRFRSDRSDVSLRHDEYFADSILP